MNQVGSLGLLRPWNGDSLINGKKKTCFARSGPFSHILPHILNQLETSSNGLYAFKRPLVHPRFHSGCYSPGTLGLLTGVETLDSVSDYYLDTAAKGSRGFRRHKISKAKPEGFIISV